MMTALSNSASQFGFQSQTASFMTAHKAMTRPSTLFSNSARPYSAQKDSNDDEEGTSSSSSSDSDAEDATTASRDFPGMEDGKTQRKQQLTNRIGGLDAMEALQNLHANVEKVAEMDEQSLSVYMSMIARACTINKREAQRRRPEIGQFTKAIRERIEKGMESGDVPNILHETGNLKQVLDHADFRGDARGLSIVLSRAVSKIFRPVEGEEVPEKFKNLSFYKTTMIFCGLEAHQYLPVSLINRKIQE
jgi:hypothetical protein